MIVDDETRARQLEREATKLLRRRGYTWDGREARGVQSAQASFERRLIATPQNGNSGWKR